MRRTAGLSAAALVVATLAAGTAVGTTTAANGAVGGFTRPAASDGYLARTALAAVAAHPQAVHAGAGQAFAVAGALVDPDGTSHVRMTRTYRGLEVVGGDLVVHRSASGAWRGSSQSLTHGLALAAAPTVSQATAKAAALAPSRVTRAITGAGVASSRLVVDATATPARLAYEVITGGTQKDGTPSRLATYVDARTGRVLRTEQQIETVGGSGQSLYGGKVPLQLTLVRARYQLKDPTRGNSYTTDMRNSADSTACQLLGTNCAAGTLFTSRDRLFGNGLTSSRESAAVDAQYGTDMTWDYYKNMFGRRGIYGTGAGSFNRVHYGQSFVNAFWDRGRMTYGDGDGVNYGPFTSLDVAGHEMSHGVTEHTAKLTYSGESGGLNEATSDIFGSAVEFYARNPRDPGDYMIGEEFDLAKHVGFRRMDKPSSDGGSVDCWTSTTGGLDPHYSSGVGHHFFYLLAEGSGAKTLNGVSYDSPTCDGSDVTGIGRDVAARIWYRALTVYMTSSTTYLDARTATLNAARDLYGAGGTQYKAVDAAWAAVDVS